MNKMMKKATVALLALAVVGGGLPALAGGINVFKPAITAEAAAKYDIYVAGERVTTDNAEDILRDGVFSYDGSTDTLTIKGDYTNKDLDFNFDQGTSLIRTLADCTIVIADDSVIDIPNSTFICSSANVKLKGPGKLTLNCDVGTYMLNPGIMAVIDSDIVINLQGETGWGFAGSAKGYLDCKFYAINSSIDIKGANEYGALRNFWSYLYKDCYITSPEKDGYYIANTMYYDKKTENNLENISIRPDKSRSSVEPNQIGNNSSLLGDINRDGQLNLADVNYLYEAAHNPYDPDVFVDYDNILARGDVFNRGDGIDDRDVMVLEAWNYNSRKPYYGAIPERTYTSNANGGITSNELTGKYIYNTEHEVKGVSLTLDGAIGVNFYVSLDEYVSKAVLSGPEGDTEITDFSSLMQTTGDYKGTYKLTYYVNSNHANEKVTLKLYDVNGKQLIIKDHPNMEFNYSISDSINYYKAHADSYIPEINALVNKLDTYCKASDNYFNHSNNAITGVSDISVYDTYNPYEDGKDWLAGCKMALLLNTKTSVRFFYEGDEELAILKMWKADELKIAEYLTKKHNSDGDYFEVRNIPAHRLSELFVVEIGDKTLVNTALSYGYLVKLRSNDSNLRMLACALYDYAKAAEAYYNTFID